VTAGITGATRVYLHLAPPSAHARTPQVMNAEFARRGVDAVAVSADVAPGDLGGFARGLRGWRNLAGLSVTMPHKEALAAHVDELGQASSMIANDLSLGRLKTLRDHARSRVSERNSHDHEGFGTAESTKSFAIMKSGGGGLLRACTWGFTASFASRQHHASRAAATAERFPPLNVEYSAYVEGKVPPGVPNPP
jgi:shikimate dehydrogenase